MENWGSEGSSKVWSREKDLELASEMIMSWVTIDSISGFGVWFFCRLGWSRLVVEEIGSLEVGFGVGAGFLGCGFSWVFDLSKVTFFCSRSGLPLGTSF
jgi:hypothetical protein